MSKIFMVLFLTTACGPLGRDINDSYGCMTQGEHCDESSTTDGHGDGNDPQVVQGPVGPVGRPGTDGKVGSSGATGPQGAQGESGATGPQGAPGVGCSVSQAVGGALITCGATSVVVLDGAAGTNGTDGQDAPPTPYTVTEMLDPCGDESGYDEILLRLANGALIAHYASGSQQFLTSIGPGNYVTTDGHSCYFTVNSDMSVTW